MNRRRAGTRLALAALVVTVAVACGAGPVGHSVPAPAASPTVAPTLAAPVNAGPLVPSGSIYFGGFADPSGLPNGNNPTSLAALEAQLGRPFALNLSFVGFLTLWPTLPMLDNVANNRLSVAFWDCSISNAQIVAGTADAALQTRAAAVAAFGRPIMISFFYEINVPSGDQPRPRPACYDATTDEANGAFSPAEFIAAWQHIRAIFTAAGATNAIWVWTVGASSDAGDPAVDPRPYYPGDSQVDWIGVDVFDFAGQTFAQTAGTVYAQLAPFGKPILIAESGADPSTQTAYFQSVVPTLQSQFPLVKGFMYYDTIGTGVDWRVTPASFPAFEAMANDPYMSARPSAPAAP